MKSMSRWKKIRLYVTILVLLVLCAAAGVAWRAFDETRLMDIRVEGNSHYSESELVRLIFPENGDRRTALVWLKERFGKHEEIPFVSRYEITLTGKTSCEIMVYEKNIVACIEYMGNVLYFDKDGIVVEIASENTENVPAVTGIRFRRMVLYEPMQVENDEIFQRVLEVTQGLKYRDIPAQKIYFNEDLQVRVTVGNIRVELGDSRYLSEKLVALAGILPELKGRSGILYLENYSSENSAQVRFHPDPEG